MTDYVTHENASATGYPAPQPPAPEQIAPLPPVTGHLSSLQSMRPDFAHMATELAGSFPETLAEGLGIDPSKLTQPQLRKKVETALTEERLGAVYDQLAQSGIQPGEVHINALMVTAIAHPDRLHDVVRNYDRDTSNDVTTQGNPDLRRAMATFNNAQLHFSGGTMTAHNGELASAQLGEVRLEAGTNNLTQEARLAFASGLRDALLHPEDNGVSAPTAPSMGQRGGPGRG